MIRSIFMAFAVTVSAVTASAQTAPADCAPLGSPSAYEGVDIATLQRGLLAYTDGDFAPYIAADDNEATVRRLLTDGNLGGRTEAATVRFCERVSLLDVEDRGKAARDLAVAFGTLFEAAPGWPAFGQDPAFVARLKSQTDPLNRAMLRLGGPSDTTLAYLGGAAADTGVCRALTETFNAVPAQMRLVILSGADAVTLAATGAAPTGSDPSRRLAAGCTAFGGAAEAQTVLETFYEFGLLDATVPDGLARLGSAGFVDWWATQPAEMQRLLFGTAPAVRALVNAYEPIEAAPPSIVLEEIKACSDTAVDAGFGLPFYRLQIPEPGEPTEPLSAKLAPLAEASYVSPDVLAETVTNALGYREGDCQYTVIRKIIAQSEPLARVFMVSPDALQTVAATPETQAIAPALAGLAAVEATSKADLVTQIEAVVSTDATTRVGQDIASAAEIAAAAAEEVALFNDTAPDWVEAEAPDELPTAFALTEQSIRLITSQITDPDISQALMFSDYVELATPDAVKLFAFDVLDPIRAARIAEDMGAAKQFAETAVVPRWKLTEALINTLANRPDLAVPGAVAFDDKEDQLAALDGLTYPNRRLFERALDAAPIEPGKTLELSEVQKSALLTASRNTVDTISPRRTGPLGVDCGCSLTRHEHGRVYAFHPFWQWPTTAMPTDAPVPEIDYAFIDRIAFDGLVLDYTAAKDGRESGYSLSNDQHWSAAARQFVANAHRYEVKADLSIRLLGWSDWTEEDALDIADTLAEALNGTPSGTRWIPGASYGSRPDGITLLFDQTNPGGPPGETERTRPALIAFFDRLRILLRDDQEISIGVDTPLVRARDRVLANLSTLTKSESTESELDSALRTRSIFDDFTDLLLPSSGENGQPEAAKVNRILIFLERPTTDAKKVLRERIERMPAFRGPNRRDLFRKVIPVVPPSAHRSLGSLGAANEVKDVGKFGQFNDDLIYFRDNFGGIGFWNAPYRGTTDADYIDQLNAEIGAEFNQKMYTAVFGVQSKTLDGAIDVALTPLCRFICPNRNFLYALTFWIGVAIGIILLIGLYTGLAEWVRNLVPYGFVSMIFVLVAIAVCSPSALLLAPVLILITSAIWWLYREATEPDRPLP